MNVRRTPQGASHVALLWRDGGCAEVIEHRVGGDDEPFAVS
jgi:hypothetical protein